jgi:threonine aldolase
MPPESQVREKLGKIEALFAGAGTAGERLAAEAALERCGHD